MSLETLFNPRSVAIVGASADPTKTSGLPVKFLRLQNFNGEIYPVNRRVDLIDGLRCYGTVEALPTAPDVAMIVLGASRTVDAVQALARKGTKHAIVLASGFGESGEEGKSRQLQLLEAAGSMRILGPNTIGLVNVSDGVPLSASGALAAGSFTRGSVGVVSQSGVFSVLCSPAYRRAASVFRNWLLPATKLILRSRISSIILRTTLILRSSSSTSNQSVMRIVSDALRLGRGVLANRLLL